MSILQKIRRAWGADKVTDTSAASSLAPQAPPKVRPGSRSFPSFFTTTKPDPKQSLPRSDRSLASKNLLDYRAGNDTRDVVRDFARSSPDLSAAVWASVRVGIPSDYTAVAYSAVDGSIDVESTRLLQQILQRMDTLPNYDEGYSNTLSLKSVSESLAQEILYYGAVAGELVLDKSRLPLFIQPLSVRNIELRPDGKGLKPVQVVGDTEIDLDIPTFVMLHLDQDLREPYPESPLQTAIKPVIYKEDFANDIHRIIKKVIHPRQHVKISEELFRKTMSQEAQVDADVASQEMAELVSEIESKVNGLSPEDVLVYFDSLDFDINNPSNGNLSAEYKVLQDIGNSRLSTGAKTMGTVLGFQSASSNIASSETMLFIKTVTSAIKDKLDQFYSRMLTTAVRLFGRDVVVKFRYASIDLRPEADLAAFRQTQQMIILERLSLGLITDEEASLQLTGQLPPNGYKPLSGTMFHFNKGGAAAGQEKPAEPSNSGSTLNQNLNGDTPSQGRGQNKKIPEVK